MDFFFKKLKVHYDYYYDYGWNRTVSTYRPAWDKDIAPDSFLWRTLVTAEIGTMSGVTHLSEVQLKSIMRPERRLISICMDSGGWGQGAGAGN